MLVLYLAEAVSTIVAMRHFQLIKIWDKKGKIQEKRERSGKKGKKLGGKGENLHKHRHRYTTGCEHFAGRGSAVVRAELLTGLYELSTKYKKANHRTRFNFPPSS